MNYKARVSDRKRTDNHHMAIDLVRKHGSDSLAYLTLDEDKLHFYASQTEGFIAYTVIWRVAVCVGNPVCQPAHTSDIIREFMLFCRTQSWKICFCSVSEEVVNLLAGQGFSAVKYGVEAVLILPDYDLTGKAKLKLRQKIKRAAAAGIVVNEYQPAEQRDFKLEDKIRQVSEEWYDSKTGRMGFTMGELDFDHLRDHRYFIAMDEEQVPQAVLMFSPFGQGTGYFLDVMRRRQQAVPGVMELSIVTAAMKMKEEGAKYLSLGLAPLAEIDLDESSTYLEKGMKYVFHNVNEVYSFHSLYDFKKKFAPDDWKPRFVVYQKGIPQVVLAYVMIKARNSQGITKLLLSGFLERWKYFKFKMPSTGGSNH